MSTWRSSCLSLHSAGISSYATLKRSINAISCPGTGSLHSPRSIIPCQVGLCTLELQWAGPRRTISAVEEGECGKGASAPDNHTAAETHPLPGDTSSGHGWPQHLQHQRGGEDGRLKSPLGQSSGFCPRCLCRTGSCWTEVTPWNESTQARDP